MQLFIRMAVADGKVDLKIMGGALSAQQTALMSEFVNGFQMVLSKWPFILSLCTKSNRSQKDRRLRSDIRRVTAELRKVGPVSSSESIDLQTPVFFKLQDVLCCSFRNVARHYSQWRKGWSGRKTIYCRRLIGSTKSSLRKCVRVAWM